MPDFKVTVEIIQ